MANAFFPNPSHEVPLRSPRGIWNVVVVTADGTMRSELERLFSRLKIDASWLSNVDECRKIRRDLVHMVFTDERLSDGDYWDIYSAMTRGLITKPKFVVFSRSMSHADREQAERSGIFAVLDRNCSPATIEWTVIFAKRKHPEAGT
jgi:DNA-binding NtrC family response regulator